MWEASHGLTRGLLSGYYGGAQQRAAVLLIERLSPVQRAAYLTKGHFLVRGQRWWQKYRLSSDRVERWFGFPFFHWFRCCIRVYGLGIHELGLEYQMALPIGDRLLALKLLIETDERRFRRTANW